LKVGGAESVGFVLTQITNNRFQDVLAQITRDNFFLWKDKDKKEVCVDTNYNQQISRSISTNHKRQFFFYGRTRIKKRGVCWHKSQLTKFKMC
jgi:hypothetical protein